jgi:hypothetical protein
MCDAGRAGDAAWGGLTSLDTEAVNQHEHGAMETMKTIMGERKCSVCRHQSAGVINKQMVEAQLSYRELEQAYSINRQSLNNHYRLCLLPKILSGGEIHGL